MFTISCNKVPSPKHQQIPSTCPAPGAITGLVSEHHWSPILSAHGITAQVGGARSTERGGGKENRKEGSEGPPRRTSWMYQLVQLEGEPESELDLAYGGC